MIRPRFIPRLFILYVTGMVIATIFDFEITKTLSQAGGSWAVILESVGEAPALYFTAFNLSLICAYLRRRERLLGVACSFFGSLFCCMYATGRTLSYLTGAWLFPISIPVGAGIAIVFLVLCLRLQPERLEKYFKIALACFMAALTTLVVVSLMKQLWGRVRYRQILADPALAFTDWYHINGLGQPTHVSFPSGHTANAAVIMMITLYFPRQKHWLQPALYFFIALMAVSRLFTGAHFLSDVLTGGAITLLIAELWVRAFKVSLWEEDAALAAHKSNQEGEDAIENDS